MLFVNIVLWIAGFLSCKISGGGRMITIMKNGILCFIGTGCCLFLLISCKGGTWPPGATFSPDESAYQIAVCEGAVNCEVNCETTSDGDNGDDGPHAAKRSCDYTCDNNESGTLTTSCLYENCSGEDMSVSNQLAEKITCTTE